jgi:hypothetical protein
VGSRPDTWKQSRLTAALAARGIEGGWRGYLVVCRRKGMSAAQISRHLARDMAIDLDDSTLSLWLKQAGREADNGRGESSSVPDILGQK